MQKKREDQEWIKEWSKGVKFTKEYKRSMYGDEKMDESIKKPIVDLADRAYMVPSGELDGGHYKVTVKDHHPTCVCLRFKLYKKCIHRDRVIAEKLFN